ncbi:MAG: hypothetical protein JNL02_10215 [Saprospiraceae bacterium]|nr:hypothetical protein [Saprospiraceae bacterium]MCC7507061.1 hypothetical protein [Saprospiraceae bacterium]
MNSPTISLVALLLSVFFAGAYLRGEIAQRREFRNEMKSIQAERERTMALVDSMNIDYVRRKREFLENSQKLYAQLDTLLDLKISNSRKLEQARTAVNNERVLLDGEFSDLKDLESQYGIKPAE